MTKPNYNEKQLERDIFRAAAEFPVDVGNVFSNIVSNVAGGYSDTERRAYEAGRRIGYWIAQQEREQMAKPRKSSEPDLKVGDKVTFEVDADGWPRWDFSDDSGGCGRFTVAVVDSVNIKNNIAVTMLYPNGKRLEWHWPLRGHARYSKNQWRRPGYLQKVEG